MQNAMIKVMDPHAAVPDADIAGPGGEICIVNYKDDTDEARGLAEQIQRWIAVDKVAPAQIAVLVSRQPEFYAAPLMNELTARGIPFRNEQQLQDLAAEPAAQLILDLIRVICADHQSDAYERITNLLLFSAHDEQAAYEQRAAWHRLLDDARNAFHTGTLAISTAQDLRHATAPFLNLIGPAQLAALSADYQHGKRMEDVITQTFERIAEFTAQSGDVLRAASRFSSDDAVRILTIHKSKGLEFDTVVIQGVEKETFWGNPNEQRSAYFVGISRAKQRLMLTVAALRPRPQGFQKRWDEARNPQDEFLGYATTTS